MNESTAVVGQIEWLLARNDGSTAVVGQNGWLLPRNDRSTAVVGQNGWFRAMAARNEWIDCSGRSKWMAPDEDRLEGVRLVLEWVQLVERLRGMDGSTAVVGQNGWLWAMTAWREFD